MQFLWVIDFESFLFVNLYICFVSLIRDHTFPASGRPYIPWQIYISSYTEARNSI